MANWKKALLEVGKVSAAIVLNGLLPGAGGLIQAAETAMGAKTGPDKKALVRDVSLLFLNALAKSGKLDGAAPQIAEVEKIIQSVFDAMKATGQLEESGTLSVSGRQYVVTVHGLLP